MSGDLDTFESEGCVNTFGSIDLNFRWKALQTTPKPTVLLSHLPRHMLPDDVTNKNIKIIHIRRNPKDVAVSFYHFSKILKWINYKGSWDDYFELFLRGDIPFGNWFHYTRQWLQHQNDPNILCITYEDFLRDTSKTVSQIAEFLGRTLTSEDLQRISRMVSFNSMKKNPRFNMENLKHLCDSGKFLRKGQVGDWRNYFSEEQNLIFDKLYEEFKTETGISLQFE